MKNKIFIMLVMGLAFSLVLVSCTKSVALKNGDEVLADWYEDNWHLAKLLTECPDSKGWEVDFNDDFYDVPKNENQPCYPLDKIVKDEVPGASKVNTGDIVLAEWLADTFYKAKVTKIDGDKYFVNFVNDGWESELVLDKLRLLPKN